MTPATEAPGVDIERLLAQEYARTQPPKRLPPLAAMKRDFQAFGEDRYRMSLPDVGVVIEIDRLRREHHELWGELAARCELSGARTVGGSLSIADLNVSSARARQERAKLLGARAGISGFDWGALVEEFCQRVLEADRVGQPAVDLRTVALPEADDSIEVEGLQVLRRHPTILFGDGGSAKSYLALFVAGRLAESGLSVALFDWELAAEDHRARLERLFPDGMPRVLYARCERPLVYEADRLRRIARDGGIDFGVFDSVAYACDGPPEAAEVAGRYFRAVRQIGIGSLHVAHISKSENADQRPFGSTFWHNSARSTWYVQKSNESADGDVLQVGLFHRKSNLGRLRAPLGYRITFSEEQTTFRRTDVAESPDLAKKLTVCDRIKHALRRGAMTPQAIAEEIEADTETVSRTVRRHRDKLFTVMDGGRVGLLERRLL